METYWRKDKVVHYLEPVAATGWDPESFYTHFGSYGECTRNVCAPLGRVISCIPDDLILDEALAAAKVIIMANRR